MSEVFNKTHLPYGADLSDTTATLTLSPGESCISLPTMKSDERIRLEKKLVRKIDATVLSCLTLLFIVNYLDRSAISVARDNGLQDDLHLTDVQWSTLLGVMFLPMMLCEVGPDVSQELRATSLTSSFSL